MELPQPTGTIRGPITAVDHLISPRPVVTPADYSTKIVGRWQGFEYLIVA